MASTLLCSRYGAGVPLAVRFAGEGHISKVWIKTPSDLLTGYRNPTRLTTPSKLIDQFDIVLFDGPGLGGMADDLRSKGKVVIGGGLFNDNAQCDVEYTRKIMRVVLGGTSAKVAPSTGVEVLVGGWFEGRSFKAMHHTIEKRRFMEGDKGPETESMGCVTVLTQGDKLTRTVLEPFAPLLERAAYCGPFYMYTVLDLEEWFVVRPIAHVHFDSIFSFTELLKGSLFDFMYRFATGKDVSGEFLRDQIGIAVRLSLPPYPTPIVAPVAGLAGTQAWYIPRAAEKHVWPCDTRVSEGGNAVVAGTTGIVGCVSARGDSLREARRRVYRSIENLQVHHDVQYRYDVDRYVDVRLDQLADWGWIEGKRNARTDESAVEGPRQGSVPQGGEGQEDVRTAIQEGVLEG